MRAVSCRLVNFQALPRRLTRTTRRSTASASARRPGATHALDRAVGFRGAQFGEDFLRHGGHVDGHELHVLTPDTREAEQVVDQRRHALGRLAHPPQMLDVFLGEPGRPIFEDHRAEAVDRPQRRTQVVRDRVGEGLELLVRRLQLGGAGA